MVSSHILGLVTALLAVQPVPASEPPEQEVQEPSEQAARDEIIVTAPPAESERRTQIRRMAREVVRKPRQGYPIARFFLPVCPKVVGLSPIDAETIELRIRENARKYGPGERLGKDCEPNLKVVFLAESVGPANTWLDSDSESISHLLSYQKLRVMNEEGPVRAWNVTALRDSDGRPLEALAGVNNVRMNSRLTYPVTSEITAAMMLIEFEAAKSKTLMQLADYASMRAFVGTESVGGDSSIPVDTILTLFGDPSAPGELTEFDRALVAKLYTMPRNASSARIFGAVSSRAISLENAASGGSE